MSEDKKITDPLSLLEDLNSSWQLLQQESAPVKKAILQRFKDTEDRIGITTDVNALQKLDAFRKFLKLVATQSDAKDVFIARMVKNFNSMDDAYWAGVLKGQQLEEENEDLKAEVAALKIRCWVIETGLRSALDQRRKKSAEVGMIPNRSNQAAA